MQWTGLYAAALTAVFIFLSSRVIRLRGRLKQGIGDGGHPELARAVRVHGNFIEYTPLGLILLLLAEGGGAPAWWIHAVGGGLLVGRIVHAWGLSGSSGSTPQRLVGMVLTFNALALGAAHAVYRSLAGW
jgi:uncharacterized membrane protein YecN with MAPEG domain